jgi:thiamine biosynthesis lipoprotein
VRADHRLRTVSLPEGAAIDVGGIAKGMAVDASIDLLANRGVASAAVDAGGDLAVLGLPGDRPAWTIEIETPDDGLDRPVVALSTGALATSSVGRRRWLVDGRVRHHLVDPRDGLPAHTDAWSASVLATSCRVAEVAAKAALLLGLEEGASFLRRHGLSGMFITPGGEAVEVGPVERPEQTLEPGRTATDGAAADGTPAQVVVPS